MSWEQMAAQDLTSGSSKSLTRGLLQTLREKKKRYHSGIAVFVSLVYMLRLSKQIWRQRSNSPCADTGFS